MKKLLSILAAIGMTSSLSSVIISCNKNIVKKQIRTTDVKILALKDQYILNLENLNQVNTKLKELVDSGQMLGLKSLIANFDVNSQTDVVVKITIDTTNYNLIGSSTFKIPQAIKDKTKKDIKSDEIINLILKDGDINNLNNLAEVNKKLADKASKIEGILSLTADYNYQKNLFTSVVVSIVIDQNKYNLIGKPIFEINSAISKRKVDINEAKDLASENIRNLSNLNEVNIELNKVMKYFNSVHDITFINSFSAEMVNGSETDVKVTLNVNENNMELVNGDSFVLEGAIKTDKINILNDDIKKSVSENIQNLDSLDEVKTKLVEYLNGKNAIPGLKELKADLNKKSQTDVLVTITIDKANYNLVGGDSFVLEGAIKDKTNSKITIDREALVNEANSKIQNLDSLDEVNNELNSIIKNYNGVTNIKADYKYWLNSPFLPRKPADVYVEIEIDESKYVLSGKEKFDINNALITSKPTIYINSSGEEKSTYELNLTNLDATEIKQIGFELIELDEVLGLWKIQAVHLPQKVQKVPAKISSQITSFSNMFQLCGTFDQDISTWDTSNVTDMSYMFSSAWTFNHDLDKWNTSKVTNMQEMFAYAQKFNGNISNWNTKNVNDMSYMFRNADSFNQPLNKWDTSKVTNMESMFWNATSFNQDLDKWNTSKVTDMNNMFEYATSFNKNITTWNTSKVTNMQSMFWNATSFNQDLSTNARGVWIFGWKTWDTSNVTNMEGMFWNATSFNQDLSNWNVKKVLKHKEFDFQTKNWNQPKPNFVN